MTCEICGEPVSKQENHAYINGQWSHTCCLIEHLAFEMDNTMMVIGLTQLSTPLFVLQAARKRLADAFVKTFPSRCQHDKGQWKACGQLDGAELKKVRKMIKRGKR